MKLLLFDIETAPSLGWFFDLWKEGNIVATKDSWYMLSFAAKWLDEKKVHVYALPDFKGYKKNPEDDQALVTKLWEMIDEADIIIAHNGNSFDIKKANARFITHGLTPPSPYKTIDTLKVARSNFKFDSNKLDSLGEYLGVGRKLPHTGFHLWRGCMQGDMASWKIMKAYNAQDVRLLERVYLKLRPWHKNHPNVNLITRKPEACPACGHTHLQSRGFHYNQTSEQRKYQCMNCFKWCSGPWEKIATKVHVK